MNSPDGTLTDAGPLFALVDPAGQPEQNANCDRLLATLRLPLVTTWPCLAEAMYLCGREGKRPMQRLLWRYVTSGALRICHLSAEQIVRMGELMEIYSDRPMDLADASLVVAAETEGYTRIFSIDSDFYVYRLANGSALEVVPGPFRR